MKTSEIQKVRKFIVIAIAMILGVAAAFLNIAATVFEPKQPEEAQEISIEIPEISMEELASIEDEVDAKFENNPLVTKYQKEAHKNAQIMRACGLSEDSPEIQAQKQIWADWDYNLSIIAKVIYKESGGCSEWHQGVVGQIVMNRVNHPEFPNTVYDVVTQKNQYSTSYTYGFDGIPYSCYVIAAKAINMEYEVPENVVYQANFPQGSGVWQSVYVDTGWFRSTTYFCYR